METQRHTFSWPDEESGPWTVTLHLRPVDGRLECVSFEIRTHNLDRRLPATMLRSVPLGTLISQALQREREYTGKRIEAETIALSGGRLNPEQRMRLELAGFSADRLDPRSMGDDLQRLQAIDAARKGVGGRKGHGPEHYEQVASVYADAWSAGGNPTQAVAERWTVSKATAAKWVSRARRHGFLEPTTKGRPGGVPLAGDEE